MWAAQYLTFNKPRHFISSGGLGTMGFGLGASIGTSVATGKRTVLVTGDGSFAMCCQELACAVENELPITILLLNNGVLGMVRQWQTLFFDKHYSNTVLQGRKTDFVKVIQAFGGDGEKVGDLQSLESAIDHSLSQKGPYLIEVAIDKDEMVMPMMPPGGSVDEIITSVGK